MLKHWLTLSLSLPYQNEKAHDKSKSWTIMTDRSSVHKRGGLGVIINTSERETLEYGVRLQFLATNN